MADSFAPTMERSSSRHSTAQSCKTQLDRKTDTWLDQGNWIALLLALGLLPLFRRGALSVLLTAPLLWSAPAEAQLAQHLWQTPDQQGAQAAAEGNHEKAATLFENPAWRGVSQYRAGQWTEATKSFEANDTANSWYNRGNSLAQAGQYENAIAAYDQSLNLQPDQADALKNRDIVRQLLEQQNQDSEQDQQSENGSDNQEQQSDQQNKQSGDSEASDDQNDQQSPEDSNSSEDSNGSPDSSDSPQENSQSGEPSEQEQQGDEAPTELSDEQRERLAEQTRQQMGKFDEGLEKQQALEQWMRRVPDDPGGLLQRKFRYETIQRLRQGEEPDNEVRW
ncbi:MAG: tetratricopeptide repeat protein [Cellvibrionales bacterium]|nr:tetratricopeptide repeat protein [Cellvibrionales bacterium]